MGRGPFYQESKPLIENKKEDHIRLSWKQQQTETPPKAAKKERQVLSNALLTGRGFIALRCSKMLGDTHTAKPIKTVGLSRFHILCIRRKRSQT